ncbi:MAG: leucine-rich repeat protein, partial [Oscillospiraceae bacterium]|nr:leucine-rich repeat protein [Oscillospiraceae bacterium]
MKTRILSLLLALALLCAVLPQFTLSARAEEVYAGSCGENLTWRFDPDTNTLTIEGFGPMDDSYAFLAQPWCLLNDRITTVVLPDGLTALAEHAFEGLGRLDTIRLPESLTSIPDGAFFDCGLKELE